MKQIANIDKDFFLLINRDGQNAFFDAVMPFLRNPLFWVPIYLAFLIFALLNFKKHGIFWSLFLIATVSMTDMISSKIFKPLFGRIRPCNATELYGQIHVLVGCGGNGSFTSSHAANHFGIASFVFFSLAPVIGNKAWFLFLWAAIICYAQVYVGVHYPGDVIGGAVLGILIGKLTATIFNKNIGLNAPKLI